MMKTQLVKISDVKINPNNPRIIKDDKFHKLVKSIQEFPKMLEIRPIVVNQDMIVLGGNMRLKACKEAGLKEVHIVMADDLTEEEQRQFIIKDNVGFGEWDWEMLANEWDSDKLEEWGLDVPNWSEGIAQNEINEDNLDFNEEFDPVGESTGKRIVQFIFDGDEEAKSFCKSINCEIKIQTVAWRVDLSTQFT